MLNPKSTGLFPPGAALGGVFHPPPLLCKIRSRHPRKLKFTGLIAYVMFYKICEFESLTVINDVIMTSLPKTMGKCGILSPQNLIQIAKRFETWRDDSLYRVSKDLRFSNPNNVK